MSTPSLPVDPQRPQPFTRAEHRTITALVTFLDGLVDELPREHPWRQLILGAQGAVIDAQRESR